MILLDVFTPYLAEIKSIQVAINWPSVYMCGMAVWYWRTAIIDFWRDHEEAASWFGLGIFIGFLFKTLDHSYWAYTWDADYLSADNAQYLFDHGPVSNVLFRIPGATMAAYCHIRSARAYFGTSMKGLHYHIGMVHMVGFMHLYYMMGVAE